MRKLGINTFLGWLIPAMLFTAGVTMQKDQIGLREVSISIPYSDENIDTTMTLVYGNGEDAPPTGTWVDVTYTGSLQAKLYLPVNYTARSNWPTVMFMHGQGPQSNYSSITSEGLPLYIQNGKDFPCIIICPHVTNSTWTYAQSQPAYTWIIANYGSYIDENRFYPTGLSLGGIGSFNAINGAPSQYAASIGVSGTAADVSSSAIQKYVQVPFWQFHGTADNTQNMSTFNVICDSLWNRAANDPAQMQVLPRNTFVWNVTHSSTIWNDSVYAQFDKYLGWLLLHHKNKDSTAKAYVDSAGKGSMPAWDFYWQAKRAVDAMSSSSFKTTLLADLADIYTRMNGAGSKRYVLDLGISGKTSSGNVNNMTNGATGANYTNLIDDQGNSSSIGFNVVARVTTGTVTVDKGVPAPYHGFPSTAVDDSWEVFNNGGTVKFFGLNNAKQYHIRIAGVSDQTVSASVEFGIKATIAGSQKIIRSGFRSFTRFMEWRNVSPTSGEISIALSSYVTNGWGSINAIELVEVGTGNESPVADAGVDQFLTQPTSSTTLTGSGTDVDGTIASYAWTKLSGPSCTIASPSSQNTNITGMSTAGVYVFQLQVTDNGGATGVDQVSVTVNASTPIVANAGPDQTIPNGLSVAFLDGSNSTGTNLTYSWRNITNAYNNSNGSKGKINHPTSSRTGVKLLGYRPGGWTYELTISDGTNTDKDTTNIYVQWPDIPDQNVLNGGVRLATTQDSIEVSAFNPGACRVGIDVMVTGANGYGISGEDSVGSNYLSIYVTSTAMPTTIPGAKIFIKGGRYRRVEFVFSDDFKGTSDNKSYITYYGDQPLRCQEFVWSTTGDFRHVIITGDYIPGVCGTPAYQGHKSGYAFSRGKYGIQCLNDWSSIGTNGFNINSTVCDSVEISYIEAGEGNFNSLNLKKESADNAYRSIYYHDLYIHNSGGENIYLGSTGSYPQTRLYDLRMENIRSINSGNENMQIGKQYGGGLFKNNVIIGGGRMAYSPFGVNQDGIVQFGYVAKNLTFRDNIVMASFMGYVNQGNLINSTYNEHTSTDTTKYLNNLWLYNSGDYGAYYSGTTTPNSNMTTYLDSNRFGKYNFFGGDIYVNSQASNKQTMNAAANTAKYASRNTWRDVTKSVQWSVVGGSPTIDTTSATVTSFSNPQFVNSGWASDFDYNSIFNYCDTIYKFWGWEPTSGLSGVVRVGEVKVYDSLEYCMFMGKYYKSKHSNNAGNMPAGQTDSHWEQLTWTDGITTYDYPPEDFRLVSGDPYRALGMGLLDAPDAPAPAPSGGFKIRKRIKINN